MGHHTPNGMFSHTYIDDIRIAFGNCHRTDGTRLKETIRDIPPGVSHVICFPKTATRSSHVIDLRLANDSGCTIRAPATKRTYGSPFNCFENAVVVIRYCGLGSLLEQMDQDEAGKKYR